MDYQEVIELLKGEIKCSCYRNRGYCGICTIYSELERDKIIDACKCAISAMQELQEYHKTGLSPKQVADTICELSATKRVLGHYQQLGTLEEIREAVEKQKKKKPRASNRCYVCPHCGLVTSLKIKHNYCDACGQHIDWSEKESTEPYHPDKCHGCFGAENNDCERCADGNEK